MHLVFVTGNIPSKVAAHEKFQVISEGKVWKSCGQEADSSTHGFKSWLNRHSGDIRGTIKKQIQSQIYPVLSIQFHVNVIAGNVNLML